MFDLQRGGEHSNPVKGVAPCRVERHKTSFIGSARTGGNLTRVQRRDPTATDPGLRRSPKAPVLWKGCLGSAQRIYDEVGPIYQIAYNIQSGSLASTYILFDHGSDRFHRRRLSAARGALGEVPDTAQRVTGRLANAPPRAGTLLALPVSDAKDHRFRRFSLATRRSVRA